MEAMAYQDPGRFRQELLPCFVADEVRHNLILGLVDTLVAHPEVYPDFGLWAVHSGGTPVVGALRTRPFNLVLGDLPGRDAALVLARSLESERLPGSVGVLPGGEWFPEAYAEVTGIAPRPVMLQGVFSLTRVEPVTVPSGRARPAGHGDLRLIVEWMEEFNREALGEDAPDVERTEYMVRRRLVGDDPLLGFWLWEQGGEPVAMTGHGGSTPNGIRIGPVFTPPAFRGAGFATAVVAAQAQWLLDQGRQFCFLYTDLSNPTSNAIYRRIGYEMHAESVEYSFE